MHTSRNPIRTAVKNNKVLIGIVFAFLSAMAASLGIDFNATVEVSPTPAPSASAQPTGQVDGGAKD